jgi:response regulator RpfG family c-di-GMP phosphodiesterase
MIEDITAESKQNFKHEKYTVLFVDDEENVLRSLNRLFFDAPIRVLTANSGIDGVEIIKNEEIAVIISDQRMPVMSGVQFLEKARELSPLSIRILLTGYADIGAVMDAINKGGAYRYITKPWNDSELMMVIQDAVDKYSLLKENQYLWKLTKKQNEELKRWSTELEYDVQQQTIDLTRQNEELRILNVKLENNLKSFITSFSNLIELRDKTVCNHSNNVAAISEEIAKRMGMAEGDIMLISIASQLHDIGKIGVPDIALTKTVEELTVEEFEEYKKHPVRGQAAVDNIEDLREAGAIIRHHHEFFDGSGFPDGLKGEDIPIGARIIALADAVDRLITGEVSEQRIEGVFQGIKSYLHTRFDPGIYHYLHDITRERVNALRHEQKSFETELSPNDLRPGMFLSKDVKTGTGLLLLGKGIELNAQHIDAIRRSYYLDPSRTGIFVIINRGTTTQL